MSESLSTRCLQTFSQSGQLLAGNVIECSEDGRIAVATSAAVYIYDICCKQRSKEQKSAVLCATIVPDKKQNLCFDMRVPLHKLSRDTDHELPALFVDTVIQSVTTEHDVFRGFVRALWSPPGLLPSDCCLLATLTADRRLRVYHVTGADVQLATSVDQLWNHYRATNLVCSASDASKFENVRLRAYQISIIDMLWTHVVTDDDQSPYCYLAAVTRAAQLSWWMVTGGGGVQAGGVQVGGVPVACIQLDDAMDDRVTSLAWHRSGWLLIGRFSGRLHGYRVRLQRDSVVMSSSYTLWPHSDRLAISRIIFTSPPPATSVVNNGKNGNYNNTTMTDSSGLLTVAVSKGFVVLAMRVSCVDSETCSLLDHAFVRLPGAEITGLCLWRENDVVASTLYNQFFIVTITSRTSTSRTSTSNGADSSAVEQRLELCSRQLQLVAEPRHYSCYGVAVSCGGAIVCTAERVSSYYDHLSVREPVRVSCALLEHNVPTLFSSALSSSRPLHQLADVLEALRVCILSGPVDVLSPALQQQHTTLASWTTRRLQLLLLVAAVSRHAGKPSLTQPVVTAVAAAEGATVAESSSVLCGTSSEQHLSQLDNFIERVRLLVLQRSLRSLMTQVTLNGGAVVASAARWHRLATAITRLELPDFTGVVSLLPSCAVCSESLSSMTTVVTSCGRGHRSPLCCQSVLPCNQPVSRRCQQCGSFALSTSAGRSHALLPPDLKLGDWCTYCDGRLR